MQIQKSRERNGIAQPIQVERILLKAFKRARQAERMLSGGIHESAE